MDSLNNQVPQPAGRSPPSLEELSRRGVRSLFLPYIIGLVSNSSSQPPSPREVLVLVNFRTGSITMVEGSGRIEELLRGKEGPLPASKASIEAMPKVEVMEEEFECPICLTEFESDRGGVVKEMPCKHKYHSGCIEKWLGIRGSCPICRYQMPVEEEEKNNKTGSNDDGDGEGDGESDGDTMNEDESDGEVDGESGGSFSGAGFVFHIYVAGSRRGQSDSDSDLDAMNVDNENENVGPGEENSDMDIDVSN